ncbi:hypothetical protein DERP_003565 [Dermatophagoides pteronyssinus]|uniref:Sodium/potassium-transporting ATPase subunit beta-1-interacting protein n=1 Tax=Dermatophagoides pteronyssinus TaxID=6956 RepID=A0ABQ8JLD6_DERPT|nr:hypothetical protein DERP_003565 [Dermatophagoides pteronyssinus]
MSVRIIIKIFLTLQLLLLIFRQMIDFAGIQWLMILINALAIIITITGFFGYLLFYITFQLFLILYNIYVICVYARFITLDTFGDITSSTTTNLYKSDIIDHHHQQSNYPIVHTSPLLPSAQLLSFDQNSHESLVDLCVQYIEIAIASLHIFISLLAIGLILLKYKHERDKFLRNNDKTTPPLPPYTINPQMNHYMSFTPSTITTATTTTKSSLYNQNTNSVRRSSKRRRSTRSLYSQKSKSNSLGALNQIRTNNNNNSGSLRSTISKHGHHRKSATSLLMMNSINNNNADVSFISNNSQRSQGAKSSNHSNYGQINNNNNNGVYGTIISTPVNKPTVPLRNQQRQQYQQQQQQQHSSRHSSLYGQTTNYGPKFLTSDSETDNYYHTFTPAYLNNGLANPLYGKRNSYMDSSETAI